MDGAGRSGEAVDIQKWWGSKGGTECSAWIFGQAAERGGGLRRAGAGPAAPPGPVLGGSGQEERFSGKRHIRSGKF